MYCLTKQEVKQVIEGKGAAFRPPILYDLWIGNNVFQGDEQAREDWLSKYPRDIEDVFLNIPDLIHAPIDDPNYRWAGSDMENMEEKGWDARILIEDWESEEAERFFDTFPNPEYSGLIPKKKPTGKRYTLARWWYGLFERHWSLRGMENALMDFYLYPEEIHKLYQKLTDFYMRIMERACDEMSIDGFFISDDLGTQNSPFFSMEIFREFFKPYYKQLFQKAHELGTHFWLHSCGNIQLFLPEFIEIGLDVIHPIQKYTMDEMEIARLYGDKICILAGFDVQQVIPFGTPEDVRREIRYLLDAYQREDSRLMLTMGNGSTEDWTLESLQALYEETITYGSTKKKGQNKKRNMKQWIKAYQNKQVKKPMPILSFPGAIMMGCTVEELVKDSHLQACCMKTIAERFDTGASFSLMDLSVEAEAFGSPVQYSEDEVPTVTGTLIHDEEEAKALKVPEVGTGRTGLCVEGIREACEMITDRPVLAGMIGPFTLVGRLTDMTEIMYLCFDEPEMVECLLEKATEFLIEYALAFKNAGANGICMAEPAAGLLSPQLFEEFSKPYVQKIREVVEDEQFILMYHNCGNIKQLLRQIKDIGACAYSVGNIVDMELTLQGLPEDAMVIGNIDPAGTICHGTPDMVKKETKELLERCSKYKNFVLSSGCDIPPLSPIENIQAFFDATDEFYGR